VSEKRKLGELLIEAGLLDESHLRTALSDQTQWGRQLGITLVKLGFLDVVDLLRVLSQQLQHPFIDIEGKEIAPEVLELVPYDMSLERRCVPLLVKPGEPRDELYLGMCDPTELELADDISFRTSMKVIPVLAADGHLQEAIDVNYRRRAYQQLSPITLEDIQEPGTLLLVEEQKPAPAAPMQAPKPATESEFLLTETRANEVTTSSSAQALDRSLLDALIQLLIREGTIDAGELMRRAKALAEARN
jgi:hypothetical protein